MVRRSNQLLETEKYIVDFISRRRVKATPEETQAVQVFSKQLVEDYGYKKDQIQTHPQYRVKQKPSDTKKEYPVDIAVFTDRQKTEDNIWIIVECKKRHREDGKSQLEDYLRFSKAPLGVWFNGEERLFLKKVEKEGRVLFEEIPNIPKQGQRIGDIGKFARKDLEVPSNLKPVFKSIRNYLAGNTIGATRDELLAQQLIHIIFCKIYDEKWTKPNDMVRFRAGVDEKPREVRDRIQRLFDDVTTKYEEVIGKNAEMTLDHNSIYYIVGELQNYCLTEATRDAIADAFEIFITGALKGGQGQFFTPRNVVQMMVEMLDPEPDDMIIDPACGSGGFLIDAMRYMWSKIEAKGKSLGWSELSIEKEKQKMATDKLRGIDKDQFLSQVTKAYMAIMGDGMGGVFCEDSLEREQNWKPKTRAKIALNQFSILLTNPPFGSKIPVRGEEKLKQFNLAYKWKKDRKTREWTRLNDLNNGGKKAGIEPQILFIERAIQFLKTDGRLGIVLPDGIFGNDKLGFIRDFLMENGRILAVIDVPIETFMPNTSTKTSILIYQKTQDKPEDYPIFMAVAEEVGHDRRGNPREKDDLSLVPKQYHRWREKNGIAY